MNKSAPDSGSVGDITLPENAKAKGRANRPGEPLPIRKKLPNEIPSWINQGSRHFITVNCRHRHQDQLLKHTASLLKNAQHYEKIGRWYLWLTLIMPDHIHFIATFDLSDGLKQTVTAWKSYQARTLDIEWQSDFFEHRLRNTFEFEEKCHYIRMNPIRAELINRFEKWPHVLDRVSIDGGSPRRFALPNHSQTNGGAKRPAEPNPQGEK